MAVSVVCPKCQKAITIHHPSIQECTYCNEPFPDELKRSIALDLLTQQTRRPIPITIGALIAVVWGFGWGLFLVLAPFDLAQYTIGGVAVTGSEFLARSGVNLGFMVLFCLVIGIAVWRQLPWGRAAMLWFWPAYILVSILPVLAGRYSLDVGQLVFCAIIFGLTAWYLYGNARVKAYYGMLNERRQMNG
jgi:hypothetical protein